MRVLVAIFVVAFAGLLWASIAIAQHVRRARRRTREAHASDLRSAPPPEVSAVPAPQPARTSTAAAR